jgi:hypothetical protein
VRVQGNRELAAATDKVEQDDPGWRWDAVNATRQKPPAGQNGAELIPRIHQHTPQDWEKQLESREWDSRVDVPPNVRYSPSVIAEARKQLAASTEAVRVARTMKDRPLGYRELVLPPNFTNLDTEYLSHTRDCSQLLRWDVVLAVEDSAKALAADDLRAMLNTSRSIGDEPLLHSQLSRMGIRARLVLSTEWLLAQQTDVQQWGKLQVALAADAEEPLLLYGMRGERAAVDQLFANLQSGATTYESFRPPLGSDSLSDRFVWWHYRAWLPADRAFALGYMTQCVEAAKLPVHEQPPRFESMEFNALEQKRVLSHLLLKFVRNIAKAH